MALPLGVRSWEVRGGWGDEGGVRRDAAGGGWGGIGCGPGTCTLRSRVGVDSDKVAFMAEVEPTLVEGGGAAVGVCVVKAKVGCGGNGVGSASALFHGHRSVQSWVKSTQGACVGSACSRSSRFGHRQGSLNR